MSKFKKNDRVVITYEFRGGGEITKGALGTVTEDSKEYKVPVVLDTGRVHDFYERELELTTEGGEMPKPYQRRTFKQLKESVAVKKNALWQEACDDGTQEYILLDQAFNRDPRQTQRIYDRALVEQDPKNFVEMFKVEPQYMTREELDQFEAFKASTKQPAKRTITPKAEVTKKVTRAKRASKA